MNSLDVAEKILHDAAEPLHYLQITAQILAQELWLTEGKTPRGDHQCSPSSRYQMKEGKIPFHAH